MPGSAMTDKNICPPGLFSTVRRLPVWLFIILLIVSMSSGGRGAGAQTPEKQRAFVYGINAAVPNNFVGSFAPPAARSIYLLAGQTSVISPRYTEIYFWPVTNEYQANWNALNEPVAGTLELLKNGRVVKQIEPAKYTIHFTPQGQNANAEIFLGEEAAKAEARFRERQETFREATSKYYAAQREWQAAVDAAQAQGEQENAPDPPEPPDPIGVFSNGLNEGIPINLQPGNYDLRLRGPDGKVTPGSERSLTVFAARRTAIGYTVVPETRWTTPEEVNDPNDVIYGQSASNLYLEPRVTREYPARAWDLLQNPQHPVGPTKEWQWVTGEPLKEGQLEVLSGDKVVDRRSLTPYRVKQTPGKALGYEVLQFDPEDKEGPVSPDFEAYPVRLGGERDGYQVRMVSEGGAVMPGSARLVRVPAGVSAPPLMVLPLVPVALGAFITMRRRLQLRAPRNVAA